MDERPGLGLGCLVKSECKCISTKICKRSSTMWRNGKKASYVILILLTGWVVIEGWFPLGFLETEIKKDETPIYESEDNPDAPRPREMIDLEVNYFSCALFQLIFVCFSRQLLTN